MGELGSCTSLSLSRDLNVNFTNPPAPLLALLRRPPVDLNNHLRRAVLFREIAGWMPPLGGTNPQGLPIRLRGGDAAQSTHCRGGHEPAPFYAPKGKPVNLCIEIIRWSVRCALSKRGSGLWRSWAWRSGPTSLKAPAYFHGVSTQ